MKRMISFLAAVTIAFSGMGSLAVDAGAVSNTTFATAKASTTKTTKRTGKLLTYQEAYDRLKNLSFVTGEAPNSGNSEETGAAPSTTTNNTNTTVNNNQNKPTGTTSQNKPVSTTNDVVTMTDYNGRALSSSMYVWRNTLNADQRYLYDTIKYAADRGEKSVTFKKSYSKQDITIAYNAVGSDCPYMVWLHGYYFGNYANGGYKSVSFSYDSTLVKDRVGAVQLMDDYLKPVLDKASKMSSDIDKVKYIHDWLIYSVNDGSEKSNDMHCHMAYSAIVEKKGVCSTYSHAFDYCMQKLGIVSTMLGGTTWDGSNHAWNMVKVGGDWYELDIYWDDVITKAETDYTYTCFMQTTASLKAYDTYNGVSRKRFDYCSGLPIAKGTKYSPSNYKYANGSNFRGLAKVVITKRNTNYTRAAVKSYTASSNYSSKSTVTSKSTTKLPNGWYKYKPVLTKLGVKSLSESAWTQDGNFYYIEKEINGKGSGTFIIYDAAYDNYYQCNKSVKYIYWYNYSKGTWQMLK